MKWFRKLSLLSVVTVLVGYIAGISAFAQTQETIHSGRVIYREDFETETAADGKVPTTFMQYDTNGKTYSAPSAKSPIVAKDTTASDPERLGRKYMLVGVSESAGDYTSGDTGRFGQAFSEEISGGIVRVEFDAAIYDDANIAGEYVHLGLAGKTGNTWFMSGNCVTGQLGAGVNQNGGLYKSSALHTPGQWEHYVFELNLTENSSKLMVNNETYTLNLAFSGTYIGITTYSGQSSNMAFDNFEITYSTEKSVSRTVYIDEDFEDGVSSLTYFAPLGLLSEDKGAFAAVTDTESADGIGSPVADKGNYDLGNKVGTSGLGYLYNCKTGTISDGIIKIEFDALVGNGGFGVALGSSASGGGIGTRYPLAYQRATRQFICADGSANVADTWHDSATDTGETVFMAEDTNAPLKYVKNKWTHIILEINAKTGVTVLTADGKRSAPVTLSYIPTAPVTSIGFVFRLSEPAYNGANDHLSYIDNVKFFVEPDTGIETVSTKAGKVVVDFKEAVNTSITKGDVKIVGGTVNSVKVSGDKLIAEVSGLNDGCKYVVEFSDNVKFTDGTKPIVSTYHFVYDASSSGITPVITDKLTTDNHTVGVINIKPYLESKIIHGYLAAYDEDDNLIEVSEHEINLSEYDYLNEVIEINHPYSEDNVSSVKKVKFFVWDADMIPYAEEDIETIN